MPGRSVTAPAVHRARVQTACFPPFGSCRLVARMRGIGGSANRSVPARAHVNSARTAPCICAVGAGRTEGCHSRARARATFHYQARMRRIGGSANRSVPARAHVNSARTAPCICAVGAGRAEGCHSASPPGTEHMPASTSEARGVAWRRPPTRANADAPGSAQLGCCQPRCNAQRGDASFLDSC